MKQKAIAVELRCDSLEVELKRIGEDWHVGTIKGFRCVFDSVKTHHILTYTQEENSDHRIDIFSTKLMTKALDIIAN
jgi:hypothetical protein